MGKRIVVSASTNSNPHAKKEEEEEEKEEEEEEEEKKSKVNTEHQKSINKSLNIKTTRNKHQKINIKK